MYAQAKIKCRQVNTTLGPNVSNYKHQKCQYCNIQTTVRTGLFFFHNNVGFRYGF